jgi:hypothetical protein
MTRTQLLRARQLSSSYGPSLTWRERLELERAQELEHLGHLHNSGISSMPVQPTDVRIERRTASEPPVAVGR